MRISNVLRVAQGLVLDVQAAVEAKALVASSSIHRRRAFLRFLRDDIYKHRTDIMNGNRHDCGAFLQGIGAVDEAPGSHVTFDAAGQQQAEEQPEPTSTSSAPPAALSQAVRQLHRKLAPLRLDKVFAGIDDLLSLPDPIAIPEGCWLRDEVEQGSSSNNGANAKPLSTTAIGIASQQRHGDAQLDVWDLRVPMGIVAVLSRYRPRMGLDAIARGIFAGNAMLVDGGVSVHETNKQLMACVRRSLVAAQLPEEALVYVDCYDTEAKSTVAWLKMHDRIDLAIVCGPPKLYQFACTHSYIPLIRATGHAASIYVDQSARYDTALDVIINSKFESVGSANAVTTLIIHERFPRFAELLSALHAKGCAHLIGDAGACDQAPDIVEEITASEDYERSSSSGLHDVSHSLTIKTVSDVSQALFFLELFGAKQCDAIIAEDQAAVAQYCHSVDSAVVLVNASTRLSSGGSLGCGGDMAVAVSKLHCRGPVTVDALTTRRYIARSISPNGALRKHK